MSETKFQTHTKLQARENKMTLATPWKKFMGGGRSLPFFNFPVQVILPLISLSLILRPYGGTPLK
jgi:hypothetical protein